MKKFSITTKKRSEMINITPMVQDYVKECNVSDGICVVFVPHTTAAVTVNENADPDVTRDITSFLSSLIPENAPFRHCEGNSDAHIKASLFGFSEHIIVSSGRLLLGTWQGLYFCEFDGPRTRTIYVKLISA